MTDPSLNSIMGHLLVCAFPDEGRAPVIDGFIVYPALVSKSSVRTLTGNGSDPAATVHLHAVELADPLNHRTIRIVVEAAS